MCDAVSSRNVPLVRTLLKAGVNPNTTVNSSSYGSIPLLSLAIFNQDVPMVKLLLNAGADVNLEAMAQHITPLMTAVGILNMDMIKLLLKYGTDVNTTLISNDNLKISALHMAASDRRFDIVKYLIEEHSANIFVASGALVYAVVVEDGAENLEYLLQHAHRLRGDEIWWNGALMNFALQKKAEKCIAVLLRWGVHNVPYNKLKPDDYQYVNTSHTVLQEAVLRGCWKSVKLLKYMYPMSLQENWLVGRTFAPQHQSATESLQWERKNPPRLDGLCRTLIFQQMGYNPIPKANKLCLAKRLKEFVQCKDIEELMVL